MAWPEEAQVRSLFVGHFIESHWLKELYITKSNSRSCSRVGPCWSALPQCIYYVCVGWCPTVTSLHFAVGVNLQVPCFPASVVIQFNNTVHWPLWVPPFGSMGLSLWVHGSLPLGPWVPPFGSMGSPLFGSIPFEQYSCEKPHYSRQLGPSNILIILAPIQFSLTMHNCTWVIRGTFKRTIESENNSGDVKFGGFLLILSLFLRFLRPL